MRNYFLSAFLLLSLNNNSFVFASGAGSLEPSRAPLDGVTVGNVRVDSISFQGGGRELRFRPTGIIREIAGAAIGGLLNIGLEALRKNQIRTPFILAIDNEDAASLQLLMRNLNSEDPRIRASYHFMRAELSEMFDRIIAAEEEEAAWSLCDYLSCGCFRFFRRDALLIPRILLEGDVLPTLSLAEIRERCENERLVEYLEDNMFEENDAHEE